MSNKANQHHPIPFFKTFFLIFNTLTLTLTLKIRFYKQKININMNLILLVIFGDFRITGVQNSTDTQPPTLLLPSKKWFESDELCKHCMSHHPSIQYLHRKGCELLYCSLLLLSICQNSFKKEGTRVTCRSSLF